ncbi:MAG: ADP-glyceromanno-heptose 6-epimerase [Deferribacteraceae bacterium]|jgi:ADP-L-glycero-D-manno-heptose 6-epimerase|nr:ADP-glyceromanno-heptose 6-epimerase [Deferribacteraceae bacterium]
MIVVTGGAGFIGSNLIKELNNQGFNNILIVDDLTDGAKHKNMNRLNFFDYVDYKDFLPNIDRFGVKMIFHQGACSDTTERNGRYMMQTNYEYSKELLTFCINKRVRMFYASSASVYGDGKNGFRESPECEYPLNMYAFSKYQFDRFVELNERHLSAQLVGLRYFNVYGPQENHKGKMASVAFHAYNQVKNGGRISLFEGSENFRRDFIHVDDVVKVNIFFLDNPDLIGVYNCGSGKAESFTAVAEAVKTVYNHAKIETIPFPEELTGKYQTFTQADLTKLRRDGYNEDFMDVGAGVKKYVKILSESGGYLT